MKRVLFFSSYIYDYMAETVLIGLKQMEHVDVYEYSPNNFVYDDMREETRTTMHGKGFTLSRCISSAQRKNYNPANDALDSFDFYVFSNVKYQTKILGRIINDIDISKIILVDGSDDPTFYPFKLKILKEKQLINVWRRLPRVKYGSSPNIVGN